MRSLHTLMICFGIGMVLSACKKNQQETGCSAGDITIRKIVNQRATIILTATTHPVWIIEDGTIDTRLIPCNFPMEFYQNDLRVIISGDVKSTPPNNTDPCCSNRFVITAITR